MWWCGKVEGWRLNMKIKWCWFVQAPRYSPMAKISTLCAWWASSPISEWDIIKYKCFSPQRKATSLLHYSLLLITFKKFRTRRISEKWRVKSEKVKKSAHLRVRNFLEAPPRIELGNKGFADLCLTAWLWCRIWNCVWVVVTQNLLADVIVTHIIWFVKPLESENICNLKK